MSTYYYLVCKEHKQTTQFARQGMTRFGPLAGDEKRFDFMGEHPGCDICVMDEHQLSQNEFGDFKEFKT